MDVAVGVIVGAAVGAAVGALVAASVGNGDGAAALGENVGAAVGTTASAQHLVLSKLAVEVHPGVPRVEAPNATE